MARNESVPAVSSDIHVAAAFSADRARRGRSHVRAAPARAFPHRKTSVRERGNANKDNRGAFKERKPESGDRKEKNEKTRRNLPLGVACVATRVSRAIFSGFFAAGTAAATGESGA